MIYERYWASLKILDMIRSIQITHSIFQLSLVKIVVRKLTDLRVHSVLCVKHHKILRVFVTKFTKNSFFEQFILADDCRIKLFIISNLHHPLNVVIQIAISVSPGGLRCLVNNGNIREKGSHYVFGKNSGGDDDMSFLDYFFESLLVQREDFLQKP